ncbi:hypothetical protein [Pedosphaera parvula]|uniref:Phosphate-selective porin O and P n=1 Tax=Pedosphaera parvula (strain Ellin514) TaxID=320771 RepID=B9XFQ6_PEDPL|nr:hypothetical protein [Pedosphaera parvula]EEF61420.1 conserved hypothetical protein [Pedosphaera parvula Ellin514]
MNFARKGLRVSGRLGIIAVLPFLLFTPGLMQAQTTPESSTDAQKRERIERQLQELQSMKKDLQRQLGDFDARMKALEVELGAPQSKDTIAPQPVAQQPVATTNQVTDLTAPQVATSPPPPEPMPSAGAKAEGWAKFWGPYEPGKGFVLARGPLGELGFGVLTYLRYLNKLGIDPSYTDAFGRTHPVQQRQDFQLNREQIMFRGWLFDERFDYQFWVWTQNSSMGEQTQINVGGNATYSFYEWLNFRGGIFSVPTTRSTSQSFPNWIKIDHRTMADEFFRGSYSTGIMLEGKIAPPRLQYKVALVNNLSTLGVSGAQLDNKLDTVATALWWLPTTGEFGPTLGFGDYEEHQELATLFGVHYTHSTESAQSQPQENGFENTQFFLSDGTLIFSPHPFGTSGSIQELRYQMVDLEAGMKYKGWSLEGEYYFRRLDNFHVTGGAIPVDNVFDHGFQLQASKMIVPKVLQAYFAPSKVFGQYGSPWELGFGLTAFPFQRKEMRVNFQALFESQAPAGNIALPFSPGNKGWIYTLDMGVWF